MYWVDSMYACANVQGVLLPYKPVPLREEADMRLLKNTYDLKAAVKFGLCIVGLMDASSQSRRIEHFKVAREENRLFLAHCRGNNRFLLLLIPFLLE